MASPSDAPRILVVDDEPDIAESFADLLHAYLPDARIDQAFSGPDALQRLSKGRVDLVVTDFMMPGMNGVQLLREIERLNPGTPNILVTAYETERIRSAGRPEPDRILQKPFDIDQFMGAVNDALAAP